MGRANVITLFLIKYYASISAMVVPTLVRVVRGYESSYIGRSICSRPNAIFLELVYEMPVELFYR